MEEGKVKELVVTSEAFENNGIIPRRYTGRGEDVSPTLHLSEITSEAKSIAIIMDDLDHPLSNILGRAYNHWLIWNIPVQNIIPEDIGYGTIVKGLGNAIQGIGYGKHEYRGPKPPKFIRGYHRYQFNVYVLDCRLDLESASHKKELLTAMKNHVIQYGYIVGKFKNE